MGFPFGAWRGGVRGGRPRARAALLCALLAGMLTLPAEEDETIGENPPAEELGAITQLVAELDHDRFAVRERARQALLEIGIPALPTLLEATKSESPEQRLQARDLVHEIRSGALTRRFEALAGGEGDALDVELGMWLIARLLDPEVPRASITGQLDAMAQAVRRRLGEGKELADLPPREVVNAIVAVLRDEVGLTGDEETYDHPDNSSIHRVLARKKGLPILLSEIAVAVARRLSVPLVGLAIPGRYMVKYEAPGDDDLIIDPFGGWEVVTLAEVREAAPFLVPVRDLVASDGRSTLVRMLNNLHADAMEQGDAELAEEALRYRALFVPDEPWP